MYRGAQTRMQPLHGFARVFICGTLLLLGGVQGGGTHDLILHSHLQTAMCLHSTSPPVWNHGHHRSYRIVVTVNAYTCSDGQTGSVQVLDWFQPPIFCPLQGRG